MGQGQRVSRAVVAAIAIFAVSALAEDKRKDPNEIGNRDVGRGGNSYLLEREIALGRQLAEEVQMESKVVDGSVIAEYVNVKARGDENDPSKWWLPDREAVICRFDPSDHDRHHFLQA